MNLRVTALSLFSVAALTSVVLATPVTIKFVGPADGSTENVNIKYNSYNYTGGVYTGLYDIKVDGVAYQTFCIDPLGDIHNGDTWTANQLSAKEITAGNGELFTSVYPDSKLAIEKYAMINYLADKSFYLYTNNPDSRLDSKSERSDLSLLYWEIALDYNGNYSSMNLGNGYFSSSSTTYNNTLKGLITEAYNHRFDPLTMSIYSPVGRPSQEFLAFKVANVPEPGMTFLILLGLSGLGISGLVRRKNR